MAADHDPIVLRTLIRHSDLINVLIGISTDFAFMIEPTLKRCSSEGCVEPATCKHVDLGVIMCDACAARAIVNASKNINTNPNDELNLIRVRLADDTCWIDLDDAERVRRLRHYVTVLRDNDAHATLDADRLH
jgi:hypothetical protein